MTPGGAIELPLLAAQVVTTIIAAWAGMRIVDDVKHLVAARAKRSDERS